MIWIKKGASLVFGVTWGHFADVGIVLGVGQVVGILGKLLWPDHHARVSFRRCIA